MNRPDVELEERHLAWLMQETTRDLRPPVEQLVQRGRERGLRLQRRRRAAQLAGVCVVTAALAGSVTIARPLLTTPDQAQTRATGSPGPLEAGPAARRPSPFGVRKADMAATLGALLPGTGSTSALVDWSASAGGPSLLSGPAPSRRGDFSPLPGTMPLGPSPDSIRSLSPLESEGSIAFRAGRLVYDDGHGRAQVSILVSAADTSDPAGAAEDLASACSRGASCTTVPVGRLVVTEEVPEYPAGRGVGVVGTTATLVTDDGVTVSATAYNSPTEKGSPTTRDHPPFTGAELGRVVTNSVWLH